MNSTPASSDAVVLGHRWKRTPLGKTPIFNRVPPSRLSVQNHRLKQQRASYEIRSRKHSFGCVRLIFLIFPLFPLKTFAKRINDGLRSVSPVRCASARASRFASGSLGLQGIRHQFTVCRRRIRCGRRAAGRATSKKAPNRERLLGASLVGTAIARPAS